MAGKTVTITWPDDTEVIDRLDRIEKAIAAIQQKETGMATQADIDAFTQRLTDATQAIQQELATLQSANPSLDLSSLNNAVASVESLEPPPASDAPATGAPATPTS